MARLHDHSNCPNPMHSWGYSTIRAVYVREEDPETGKKKWVPVGWICMGCGVFRSDRSYFDQGPNDPVCTPRQPARE